MGNLLLSPPVHEIAEVLLNDLIVCVILMWAPTTTPAEAFQTVVQQQL